MAWRTPDSMAIGTSRSMAASTLLGWRNLSSMMARVPRMVSPNVSNGALQAPAMNGGRPRVAME